MEIPFKVKRIDHVAFCVPDGDAAAARFAELFGLVVVHDEHVVSQKVQAKFLVVGEGTVGEGTGAEVEIIAPRGNETIERFLEKRGPGLHHLAIEVEGIEEALAWLKSRGVPLVDETPRIGARGHKVAFLHPKATGGMLVELLEKA
jgi:methylmalonyl-CoA/ethylmalonyl-CoA epimerase